MRICIPLRPRNLDHGHALSVAALRWRSSIRALTGQDMLIELWVDRLNKEDSRKLIKKIPVPVIGVCRSTMEKGTFKGNEKQRIQRLEEIVSDGAAYIDVGLHTSPLFIAKLKKVCFTQHVKLIISHHDYKCTPNLTRLMQILLKAQSFGADIVKIVTQVNTAADNAILMELTMRAVEKNSRCVIFGMGKRGCLSRLACTILGSHISYASLESKEETASGQLTIQEYLSAPIWHFK